MKIKALISMLIVFSAATTSTAMAVEKGDWIVRAGWTSVAPKSNNSDIVSVRQAASLGVNLSYFATDNLAVELLAAYPFEHDIQLIGGPTVATTEHLPPTVSVQYHFMPTNAFKPYVGVGVNYTAFFSTKTTGALEDSVLKLGDSWGFAGEVGVDIMLGENWLVNASARYIDIESKARLDGESIGTVAIDPFVYSLTAGYRF
ncbi:MAG: outer membrane beta-barrel protein [Xanthomonadales bacterium]|nr:outer membrane beta-barrel protein [Gammaproteobacteria bacterium]MBT8050850.1 outer membrane beta-barrel protein [Gammaproteobacteria bacterium]MBT8057750.1 outer membrane beta-barrel protein [Gammaproteobacteria bacterium]NNJ80488.1 outer membrane beta-barrel protein [Xanthomonadales bacterium]NNL04801.1 outer membrane beta-barrel protein [Xanthomonadales bacterium]